MAVVGARVATAADVVTIAGLAEAAIAELSASKGGTVWAERDARSIPVAPGIEAELSQTDHVVVVGLIGDVVVGYGTARDDRSTAVIDDLYVEPSARSVGVGVAILRQLESWAVGHGCRGLESLALPGDRATKNFFETHGLVARAIRVHRPLQPAPPAAG